MAGLGRRTFAPGEVLTASNVMNYLMDQSVQVYAGTAARGSAIGTAVSEGMVSYLADSNFIETYSGTSWDTQTSGLVPIIAPSITAASGTAVPSTDGTITFSGVSSLSLNSIFTSKYKNYKIVVSQLRASSTSNYLQMRLRNSGTDRTDSNYITATWRISNNGTSGSFSGTNDNTSFISQTALAYDYFANLDIFAPQISTAYTTVGLQAYGHDVGGNVMNFNGSILYNQQNSNDSITLYTGPGTMSGVVKIYGYR